MSEIETLKKALGLELENNGLDWAKFKVAHGLQPQDAKTEAADRAWFTWQHFRGEHRPNSCLLDDEGRVIGLIVKGTSLRELKLPSLPALSYLCICENKDLGKVEFAGEYPVLQHIDLGGNGLPRLSFKASFPALKYLNISKNSIADFKLESSLPSLIELDLSDNQIKNWLPFLIDKLPLAEYLFLNGNPLNESVTVYRVEGEDQNYLPCLKKFRSAFSAGAPVKNDEFKVLVIGDGKAGKSCMVHRLVEDKFLETWDSTHGISVKRFEPGSDTRFSGFPYKLNLWDFGGQDIYHHTHRMFLQSNTTYILLWNEDTEFKDSITQQTRRHSYKWQNKKLVYWLDYVRYLGQNSPVVVAKTKSSPLYNPVGHPDENKIRERYRQPELPYLSNFLHLDSKAEDLDENGYNDLIEGIKAAIKSLKRDELLPAHWVFIREQLEAMKVSETADSTRAFLEEENEVLDYDTYYHLAKDAGEQDPDKLLNNWLVQTGVVFYKKGLFDDKIILNQSWAIRAVYALYDRSEEGYYTDIKEEKGNFDGALLNNCWADYKPQEREWFLQFMLKAELCVEITTEKEASWDQRQFLALEMLPEKRTSGIVIQEENWQEQKTPLARLRYHYPFLHLGLIQSFIVRTYRYAEVKDIYKDGLLINVDGKKVIVEVKKEPGAKGGHSGHILVSAPASQVAVLRSIQKEFESIHADHKVEQQICVGDSPWIKWDTLVARPGEEYLVSIDEAAVPAAPYRIFLADKEQPVDSLSETLIRSTTVKIPTTNIDNMTPEEIKKIVQDHRGINTNPSIGPQKIEVAMATDAKAKIPFEKVKKSVKLFFTAATPMGHGQLNTGLESRFEDLIKQYDEHRKIKFEQAHGLKREDFRLQLANYKPHILHFGGHGEADALVLQDEPITTDILVRLARLLDDLQLVVLNACNTLPIAKELAKYVPYVIGTQGPLKDDAAIAFARGFYGTIAGGNSVEYSFDSGLIAVAEVNPDMEGIPVLLTRKENK